ncbi:hypothetical protein [Aquisalimonas asiatica]|uniref:Uncharacterized protein n=1 Tax=Aquisalimonas asiatica TaxID=406100 RepID=A0A1H8SRR1_9GAMM|nr:hypothetical protein [Aquisalimonas asiatica]SEO81402.1 hypothetical protein SAMN04488052_103160 [Aquisalimonas asiatica]
MAAAVPGRPFLLIAVAATLLGGCLTDSDSPESCRYAVTQDLDDGRYERVLDRVDSRACQAAMSPEERDLNRAAAYIGLAGYDLVDIVNIAIGADRPQEDQEKALEVLRALRGLGAERRGLRFLDLSRESHERMVTAFPDGLGDACRRQNRDLLSDLQQDACFISGLVAYARFARSVVLLLGDQLDVWLDRSRLTCDNDRNASGVPDDAEITACAIQVRDDLDQGSGTCQAAGTRNGQATGAVTWETLTAHPELAFLESGDLFANLQPIRVSVAPGDACQGRSSRTGVRLIQDETPDSSVAIMDGFCEVETTRGCTGPDPDAGCWPCPVPRADRFGAITVQDTALDSLNLTADHLIGVSSDRERDQALATLNGIRAEICDPVAGTENACPEDADGILEITNTALQEYLRR